MSLLKIQSVESFNEVDWPFVIRRDQKMSFVIVFRHLNSGESYNLCVSWLKMSQDSSVDSKQEKMWIAVLAETRHSPSRQAQ